MDFLKLRNFTEITTATVLKSKLNWHYPSTSNIYVQHGLHINRLREMEYGDHFNHFQSKWRDLYIRF